MSFSHSHFFCDVPIVIFPQECDRCFYCHRQEVDISVCKNPPKNKKDLLKGISTFWTYVTE